MADKHLQNLWLSKTRGAEEFTRVREVLKSDSDCGCPIATNILGQCYNIGYGEKDEEKAFELYKKEAETGYVRASFCVAQCYYFGEGVDVNKEKAFEMETKILLITSLGSMRREKDDRRRTRRRLLNFTKNLHKNLISTRFTTLQGVTWKAWGLRKTIGRE